MARDVITRRPRIAELEEWVLDDLSLRGIGEGRAMIGDESNRALEAQANVSGEDPDLAGKRLSTATVARANAKGDLGAVGCGGENAELVELRTTLQKQIEKAILEHMERDFGCRLAEDAIRRCWLEHRSDMMAATEGALAESTNGAYQKLQAQPDGAFKTFDESRRCAACHLTEWSGRERPASESCTVLAQAGSGPAPSVGASGFLWSTQQCRPGWCLRH